VQQKPSNRLIAARLWRNSINWSQSRTKRLNHG